MGQVVWSKFLRQAVCDKLCATSCVEKVVWDKLCATSCVRQVGKIRINSTITMCDVTIF